MSGCLISVPFACTVMSSLPSVPRLTSSTKRLTFSVWNSLSLYGVGMSHFWACAVFIAHRAAAASSAVIKRMFVLPDVLTQTALMVVGNEYFVNIARTLSGLSLLDRRVSITGLSAFRRSTKRHRDTNGSPYC